MAERPKIVIIGGGFGGLWAAFAFKNKPVDVTVIDRKNHHVFQPLLYQVATAVLSPGEIAQPIRRILHNAKNIEVILGEVGRFRYGRKCRFSRRRLTSQLRLFDRCRRCATFVFRTR